MNDQSEKPIELPVAQTTETTESVEPTAETSSAPDAAAPPQFETPMDVVNEESTLSNTPDAEPPAAEPPVDMDSPTDSVPLTDPHPQEAILTDSNSVWRAYLTPRRLALTFAGVLLIFGLLKVLTRPRVAKTDPAPIAPVVNSGESQPPVPAATPITPAIPTTPRDDTSYQDLQALIDSLATKPAKAKRKSVAVAPPAPVKPAAEPAIVETPAAAIAEVPVAAVPEQPLSEATPVATPPPASSTGAQAATSAGAVAAPAFPGAPAVAVAFVGSSGLPEWKGEFTGIRQPRNVVIDSESEWKKFWREHGGKGPAPEVHFEETIVVGVFAGAKPDGSSIEIVETEEVLPPGLVIYFKETFQAPANKTGKSVYPYHMWVIIKTSLPIEFKSK